MIGIIVPNPVCSMSLQHPNPERGTFFGPALIGACLGIILSIPIAAYCAAWLGDTYHRRALIYCAFLLWCVVGAIIVFRKTYRAEKQRLSLIKIIQWCLSLWLWPLLILGSAVRR